MLRSLISRSLVTVAAVGVALALTAGPAQAAVINFTVDEGAVTLANDVEFTANGITGKYTEYLVITGNSFTAYLVVQFTDYTIGGSPVSSQVAPATGETLADPNLYSLYALVTASGTVTLTAGPTNSVYDFSPTSSTANLYTDPSRDTTTNYTTASTTGGTADDQYILSANTLDPTQSLGSVTVRNSDQLVLGGFYALFYTDPTLQNPTGPLYWPTLAALQLYYAIASGDVDPTSEGSVFPSAIRGDTSIAFVDAPIPEPSTLLLLGVGLVGCGVAARRRRAR